MAFEVTDEMIEKARDAYHEERSSGFPRQGSSSLMRAAIKAIAPMIRNQVLEEAAMIADDCGITCDNDMDEEYQSGVIAVADAIRDAKTTA
jgi:hypothetical protein